MHRIVPCLLALLFLCGCAAKGPSPEESISSLITTLYTVPDDFHKEHYLDYWLADGPESEGKAISARLNHNKSRFNKGDFAEGALDAVTRYFAEQDLYWDYYLAAHNASISCTSVTSEQQEDGSWAFTAPVTLTYWGDCQRDFIHTGIVLFDSRNRITEVQITDDGGMKMYAAPGFLVPAE